MATSTCVASNHVGRAAQSAGLADNNFGLRPFCVDNYLVAPEIPPGLSTEDAGGWKNQGGFVHPACTPPPKKSPASLPGRRALGDAGVSVHGGRCPAVHTPRSLGRWWQGLAVAAALAALRAVCMAAFTALLHAHAVLATHGPRIKGLLLRRRQGRVEGLGGFAPAVGLGSVLGTQGAHAVNALGSGQLLHALAVQAGRALARLHGRGEGSPRWFLGWRQLELVLEGRQVPGAVLGAVAMVLAAGVAVVTAVVFTGVVVAAVLGRGTRRGGRGCGRWLLGQHRQGQGGQHSGGGKTAVEMESHGVSPFTGVG